jgi:hypothetical protein
MSEYERPDRVDREPSMEDLRQLFGASTPHFALHIRNRIRRMIEKLPAGHPVRVEGEREIARLETIAVHGERRGMPPEPGMKPLPSVSG